MRMRTVLIVNFFLATAHGLAFVLFPAFALTFYGVTTGPGEQLMGQLFGTELLTVALVCWLGCGLADGAALRVIGIALCVPYVVGTVVTAMATYAGVMNVFGWLGVAIYGCLAVAYGWVLLGSGSGAPAALES